MIIDVNGSGTFAATGTRALEAGLPNIVFVHGAGLDHTVWTLFNRYYARQEFNSIAVDLPGHGLSEGKPLRSMEAMAGWLLEFMDVLEMEQTALVGHSMGALVVLEAAGRRPERISQLVLLGAAAPMPVGEPLLNAAKINDPSAVDMIMLYSHSYASQLGGNPVAGINILNSNMRLLERSLHNILYAGLRACHEYTNGIEAAGRISAPVKLILGEEDKMTPPAAATGLIDALTKPEVDILPACGHFMLSEQPEAVHRSLAKSLRKP